MVMINNYISLADTDCRLEDDVAFVRAKCSIDGCNSEAITRGWCRMHYFRWRRHGDPVTVLVERRPPGTTCQEPDCDQPHGSYGWCDMHYTRWRRHGDPRILVDPVPRRGELNGNWQGDDVGYIAVHDRMRRRFRLGSATNHTCTVCGGQAAHWAYDHADPNEKTSDLGPYSTDPAHYIPMCVPCHKAYDLARLP
jgi:hypothetical protein